MGQHPDFVKLAEAYGATGLRFEDKATLVQDMRDAIATDGPVLVDVRKVRDLEPEEAVSRELALFKVSADGAQRGEVMQITDIFRGKVVDVGKRSIVIEITGTDDKIEAFEQLVRPFGLIEMVRTGEIAISRGRGET